MIQLSAPSEISSWKLRFHWVPPANAADTDPSGILNVPGSESVGHFLSTAGKTARIPTENVIVEQ